MVCTASVRTKQAHVPYPPLCPSLVRLAGCSRSELPRPRVWHVSTSIWSRDSDMFGGGAMRACISRFANILLPSAVETKEAVQQDNFVFITCNVWMDNGLEGTDYNDVVITLNTQALETPWPNFKRVINCNVWVFHGGDYEEWHLLGCYAVWLL
jgi:hypothetical protein